MTLELVIEAFVTDSYVTSYWRCSEPLPMKLRALPQSFWLQPNQAAPVSPGSVYSTLPPLPGQEAAAEGDPPRERTVTEANTDLLFSLFNSVEQDQEEDGRRRIQLIRRGR